MIEFESLSKEHIYMIHTRVISLYGGLPDYYQVTDDKIDSTLNQIYPVFDFDKYPTIFEKAATLYYLFAKNHCFVDGNKRIAIEVATLFLIVNGYNPLYSEKDGENKTLEVAASLHRGMEIDFYIKCNLAKWFKDNFQA